MKYLIAAALVAASLSACAANPPAAPVTADPKDHSHAQTLIGDGAVLPPTSVPGATLIGPAVSGPALTPKPGESLFGSAVSDSCVARHDQTPCTLTNQEAFIEILQMSLTNTLIQCYKPAASWQDLMLPPVKTGECK